MIWNLVIIGIIFLVGFLISHIINYKKLKFDNMILKKQVDKIRNNFQMYRSISDCESGELKTLRDKNAELLMENMQLKSLIGAYRNANLGGLQNLCGYSAQNIPKGAIEAVKYAMKKSHPDNGGNAEDFMRFQKVYEELTRK